MYVSVCLYMCLRVYVSVCLSFCVFVGIVAGRPQRGAEPCGRVRGDLGRWSTSRLQRQNVRVPEPGRWRPAGPRRPLPAGPRCVRAVALPAEPCPASYGGYRRVTRTPEPASNTGVGGPARPQHTAPPCSEAQRNSVFLQYNYDGPISPVSHWLRSVAKINK